MSASPMARQATETKCIPRRVVINDPMDLPADYSSTPGGTLYSTTPGGTKIVYEKSFLINLRNSPISKTPPKWDLPENLMRGHKSIVKPVSKQTVTTKPNNRSPVISVSEEADQFHMDI